MLHARGPLHHVRRWELQGIDDELSTRAESLACCGSERHREGIAGSGATDPRIGEVDGGGSRAASDLCGKRRVLCRLCGGEKVRLVIDQAAAGAEDGLAITEGVVRQTEPRRELIDV